VAGGEVSPISEASGSSPEVDVMNVAVVVLCGLVVAGVVET